MLAQVGPEVGPLVEPLEEPSVEPDSQPAFDAVAAVVAVDVDNIVDKVAWRKKISNMILINNDVSNMISKNEIAMCYPVCSLVCAILSVSLNDRLCACLDALLSPLHSVNVRKEAQILLVHKTTIITARQFESRIKIDLFAFYQLD